MSSDRPDSLFSSDKESLGDGWGKRSAEDEPALAPVDWTKLPDAPDPAKKVRARLATPAPGSQKESGLLDIQALAGAMKAEKEKEAASAPPKKAPAPAAPAVGARLATAAKGSTGSGLIDVAEIVRQTEAQAKAGESSGSTPIPEPTEGSSVTSSASPDGSTSPGATRLNNSSSSSDMETDFVLDDQPATGSGGRTMIYVMLGLLTVAVAGLAYYVLSH